MIDALSKATFSALADSAQLRKLASRYGMRGPHSFARRFVAGETTDEAVAAARRLEAEGMMVTLDHLGERVSSRAAATAATRDYMAIVTAAAEAGVSRNLSVKLTQLGLDIDRATSVDNIRRVLDVATRNDFFLRIDMEGSVYTQQTFDTFATLWSMGFRNIGMVIQSYLRRSAADVAHLNSLGTRVRLVKGAYRELKDVAFQKKEEVDQSYIQLMEQLLTHGHYPAIATHDPVMIEHAQKFASARGLAAGAFEFQMLYGVRRDLQRTLVAAGHPFRVYVPFGNDWFAYFMRRLGERPANVGFVARSLVREDRSIGT